MKKIKILSSIGVVTAAALALVACSKSGNTNVNTKKNFSNCNSKESYQTGWYS
jgi:peptide/nickel transport system substrate-binding protein